MGHINVSGQSEKELALRLMQLANFLPEAAFDELKPYVLAYQTKLD
jgi:5-(carboxyamino)imidazole ribonucleotide synthase